jgi:hypothetical protein
MSVWSKLKGLFSKQLPPIVARPQITAHGDVPCYVCSTSLEPGPHVCVKPQSTDLYTRYIATRKALKGLLLAVETDSITDEDLENARKALKLT